jgi:hypothetical protein
MRHLGSLAALAALACSAVLTTGCNDSSSPAAAATASLRVIHASPDAPSVDVLVDGNEVLTAVPFKAGSGFLSLGAGSYDISVNALTPGGAVEVIDLPNTALAGNTRYSVLAIGKVAGSTLAPLVLSNPADAIPNGQLRARVVHAAPDAPEVDVYVTAPGATIGGGTPPLVTLEFGDDAGPVLVPAGNYQVRVTLAGLPGSVAFDSGTLALAAGADLLIAAVNNTTTGPAPITLLVNNGVSTSEVLDVNTVSLLRVGHLSPDAPDVDVIVDDNLASPAVGDLPYPTVTSFLSLEPDDYNFKVVDSLTQSPTTFDLDATLAPGVRYSVLAVNTAANLEPLVLVDDLRQVATEARVRIVHGSPGAGLVDIYVTAPGADITAESPDFSDVAFKANTGYVSLAPGSYDVTVTPANTFTVAIFATLIVVGGDVYTVIARDAPLGGAPFGAVVINEYGPT